jgi:hypothetical protein
MPEPRRFHRRGSFLLPAFKTPYIFQARLMTWTDDCAPSAQMILLPSRPMFRKLRFQMIADKQHGRSFNLTNTRGDQS